MFRSSRIPIQYFSLAGLVTEPPKLTRAVSESNSEACTFVGASGAVYPSGASTLSDSSEYTDVGVLASTL